MGRYRDTEIPKERWGDAVIARQGDKEIRNWELGNWIPSQQFIEERSQPIQMILFFFR